MIEYYAEDIDFPDIKKEEYNTWIKKVINIHDKRLGDICYIFCSDEYLLEINRKYLNHHYYTDIITFNYNENEVISGDLFISIDTVKKNHIRFTTNFQDELNRVMIHGILHLLGFDDQSDEEKLEIRKKEDEALNLFRY